MHRYSKSFLITRIIKSHLKANPKIILIINNETILIIYQDQESTSNFYVLVSLDMHIYTSDICSVISPKDSKVLLYQSEAKKNY